MSLTGTRLRRVAQRVQTVWSLLGISILLLVLLDGSLRLMFVAYDMLRDRTSPKAYADAYGDASWPLSYWSEFGEIDVEWQPYVYWRSKPIKLKHTTIDDSGLRLTWNQPDPGGGALEIFTFGGSTMWGEGARDDKTIASCLSQTLFRQGIDVVVTNFGENGFVTTQELIALTLQLRDGNIPDLAVFYDGVNDVASPLQSGRAGLPQNETNRRIEFNIRNDRVRLFRAMFGHDRHMKNTGGIMRLIGRARRAIHGDARETGGVEGQGPATAQSLASQTIHCYTENIRTITALAKEYGFECLFYWQPCLYTKQHKTPYEKRMADRQGYWRPFFLEVYGRIGSTAALQRNERFHNISDMFDLDVDPAFIDFCHLGEIGNERIADRIAVDIAELLEAR